MTRLPSTHLGVLAPSIVSRFRRRVYAEARSAGRASLPWRRTRNPYRILISEVMLQQTQASRVVPKYREFLRAFPSVSALARATPREVLRAWSGLGYNRRAILLHSCAQILLRGHGGRVPKDSKTLTSLPGIGPYTAAAVRIFAWNLPETCIETNIRTVFLHEFFPRKRNVPDSRVLPLVRRTLDRKNSRRWYAALMDYGFLIKRSSPNPSRRSRTNAAATPFLGSVRYVRGRVVARVLRDGSVTEREALAAAEEAAPEVVRRALRGLVSEGMLVRRKNRYRIAG